MNMQRSESRLWSAILVSILLVACLGDGGGPTGTSSGSGSTAGGGSEPSDPQPPVDSRSVTVEMRGIGFIVPGGGDFLTVGLGESVRWVNFDGTPHTATSTSVPPGGKGFNSGTVDSGGEFVFTPNVTGVWVYACRFHPRRMRDAVISVVD